MPAIPRSGFQKTGDVIFYWQVGADGVPSFLGPVSGIISIQSGEYVLQVSKGPQHRVQLSPQQVLDFRNLGGCFIENDQIPMARPQDGWGFLKKEQGVLLWLAGQGQVRHI